MGETILSYDTSNPNDRLRGLLPSCAAVYRLWHLWKQAGPLLAGLDQESINIIDEVLAESSFTTCNVFEAINKLDSAGPAIKMNLALEAGENYWHSFNQGPSFPGPDWQTQLPKWHITCDCEIHAGAA